MKSSGPLSEYPRTDLMYERPVSGAWRRYLTSNLDPTTAMRTPDCRRQITNRPQGDLAPLVSSGSDHLLDRDGVIDDPVENATGELLGLR
jgi:hypothetical protein